ncbi:sensor histidine kinase [Undibacterium sp. JH2W]|uniref:sensor histidine kinase n=1 Tax=Undibacterium sp. JH2W TaxID=3413037 RepID=UPI003BF45B4B
MTKAPGKLPLAFLAVLPWLVSTIVLGIVMLTPKPGADLPVNFWTILLWHVLGMLALAIINTLMAYAYYHHCRQMLRLKNMLMTAFLLLVAGLPLLVTNILATKLARNGLNLGVLPDMVLRYKADDWYYFACVLLCIFMFHTSYAAWRQGYEKKLQLQIAESENLALRLHFLQGQLKPHFLFNALNSISALVRGEDRELAGKALLQLNNLLRNAVRASQCQWLNMAEEIAFVQDYLAMQSLRFGDRMCICFDIADQEWSNIAVPPLLLQPLVENAIHHSVEKSQEYCTITLALRLQDNIVIFEIRNPHLPHIPGRSGHGLGISTIGQRLLILYQQNASLQVHAEPDLFTARLEFPARAHAQYITQ